MTKCLVALGSNLGDRAATLDGAIAALAASAGVESVEASAWQLTLQVGGDTSQREFLNGAAIVETSRGATDFHALLEQIETQFGRERHERWGSRTLDLDLLLYGDAVIDTRALTVPHPRMSFRRFVLEPAVEIAGDWVHPTIGWTLERLLDHLESGSDCVAIVSADDAARQQLAAAVTERYGVKVSSANPKLTILLGGPVEEEKGGGPTLRIVATAWKEVERDAFAAIEAVWPRLGSAGEKRLQCEG